MKIVREKKEIEDVMVWADDTAFGTHYPAEPYEEGVKDMYLWLTGQSNSAPSDD